MKIKLVTGALSLLTMVGLTFIWGNASFAAGQTCVWTGAGSDKNFSTVANWSACGGSTPTAGDIVVIGFDTVTDQDALVNDTGVALGGLTLAQPDTYSTYKTVAISALNLADGAVINDTGLSYGMSVVVAASAAYEPDTSADVTGLGSISLASTSFNYKNIKATGSLIMAGSSYFYKPGDQMAKLVVNNGSKAYFDAYETSNTIAFPIELNGGGDASLSFSAKCDVFGTHSCQTVAPTDWILTGATTVNAASTIDTGENTTVYFAGTVNDKTLLSNGVNQYGEFKFGTPATAAPSAKEEITLSGETAENVTVTLNQIAILTGVRSSISVVGELKGTGTVTNQLNVGQTGKIAPGMSPGCITAGTFSLIGEYAFELGGNVPCTGYDQIKITEPTNDSVFLGAGSVLTTSRYNNFTPTQGKVFTIIDNQGAKPVTGTFNSLPESATFTQNGVVFKISYVGGTGNDVTLTVVNQPTAPNTGFELVRANPVITAAAAIMATLALLVIGRRLQTQR
ncbi:hypothetical protein H7142_01555 [Candidatus Saccharibacteria bacterium]|nr:hypothetical protein [Candidatus Saccharibacteria bacterium]